MSKRMQEYETRYTMMEKYYIALVWATGRLRHYETDYTLHLVSRLDTLKYLLDRPALSSRLARWLALLSEYDIQYVTQCSIMGGAVVYHLPSFPMSDEQVVDDEFPNEHIAEAMVSHGWQMYFDGVANQSGYGLGILMISPQGERIPSSVRLTFEDDYPTTNNIVEYEACILGLETALDLGVR